MISRISAWLFPVFCAFFLLYGSGTATAREQEKTYDISLVKTAKIEKKDIRQVGDKKVFTQTLTIRKGEWVWKILREKGLLQKGNLPQLLSVLKRLNKSFQNLNLVHPGERIIIPLKIVPISGGAVREAAGAPEKVVSLDSLKGVRLENYSVQPGDSLTRVVKGRCGTAPGRSYREYLELVKRLNPSIVNPDLIYPGQVIRLPIYSPEVVRKSIPAPPAAFPRKKARAGKAPPIAGDIGKILTAMGEKWIDSGKHFIPLKSGGQIDLEAASFPIVSRKNGLNLIVDLNGELPRKMERLIASSWGNYRVVHLDADDDLPSALDKIIRVCDFPRVFGRAESLELEGDISFRITGDWIIEQREPGPDTRPAFVVLNLAGAGSRPAPRSIRDYLKRLGVAIIDYPPGKESDAENAGTPEVLSGGKTATSLVRSLLRLTGRSFSTRVKIPVYQSRRADLRLMIIADFFLKVAGEDAIISLGNLDPEITSFLKEHRFRVLSLAPGEEPQAVVRRTLAFIGQPCDSNPHVFKAGTRGDTPVITLTLPGDVFQDRDDRPVLATRLALPDEMVRFLSLRNFRVMMLVPFSAAASGPSPEAGDAGRDASRSPLP